MFKDDFENLPKHIPDDYSAQTVLAEQIKLLNRNLPLTLMGAIFTSVCLYISMFLTYDLSTNQKILNTIWLVYHTVVVGLWLSSWQLIYKKSDVINLKLLRKIFWTFILVFAAAVILGVPFFINLLQNTPFDKVHSAKSMIGVWVFFHIVMIGFCWLTWRKIRAFYHHHSNPSTPLLPADGSSVKLTQNDVPQSHSTDQTHYIAHYAIYSISLVSALALGCLWAIAIGLTFTTNLQNYTQVIVIMGLQFGIMSGAISSVAMFLRLYMAFAVPNIIVWLLILFYFDDLGLTILAVAVIVLILFDIFFARHSRRNTLDAILINLENNNLIAQLQIKTQQVEEASLAKTKFLADASHDLRQPVHAMSLFIEALIDTDLDNHQAQIVGYAKSASQSSREMLNTILDYAHIESGQMTPNLVATDINTIIRHLIDEFGIQAQNKGLSLRYEPTNKWVMTDSTMLALILRNLISNAIRYTSEGGILVSVNDFEMENQSVLIDYCRISVQDSGDGMTTDETERIFESFYQIERNKKSDQGLGLGLAIVKGMVQLLDAKLNVESDLNKGSQFSIALPTCQPNKGYDLSPSNTVNHLQGKEILIVDDDDVVLRSMQLLLQSWGCYPITAKTLKEAVRYYRMYKPDIVITDFRLDNGITGEDVILAIKNTSKKRIKAQFVILTADTSPKLFKATQRINPTILHKPVDPRLLRQYLEDIIIKQQIQS